MALLRSCRASVKIPCRCLVGRSSLADLVLESRRASNEHASIGWYARNWFIRDLGSSNGTTVNGRPLVGKERVSLVAGNTIRFGGDADEWEVVDVSAPAPCAVRLGPQEYIWGEQGVLMLLPDAIAPEASVYFDHAGWHVDDGSSSFLPDCGDILRLPSGHFRLLLPDEPDMAVFTAGYQLDLSELELTFVSSADSLVVHLTQGSKDVRLPARACLQTLLLLAEIRARSNAESGGWIGTSELAAMRACTPEKIAVDIHRLRKLLEEAGVHGAARIVERDDTKKLRIGIERTRQIRL